MNEPEVSDDQGSQQQEAAYYNPRPSSRAPDPRVEVQHTRDLTGNTRSNVRIVFGTEGASSVSSVFTLCNSAIGAGVLSLPYAFQCAGLVGCLILSAAVAAAEGFTMYVLAKFAERYDSNSYGQLIRRALGRKTAAGLSAVLLVYLWGSCVAYLVIVADTFTNLSAQYMGPDALPSQRPFVLLVVGLLVLLMCFPRNLQALERVSFAAVLGFVYTSGAVLVRGTQAVAARPDPWSDIKLFQFDITALYAVSIVVFGFNCHANVVSVFYELEHYPDKIISRLPASPSHYQALGPLAPKPSTHKLIGMLGAIICAASIIFVGYMSVGVAGHLAYPLHVSSNILNSFPPGDVVMQVQLEGALQCSSLAVPCRYVCVCRCLCGCQVARAVIGCVVIGHYPLNHHPARKAWEDLLDAVWDIKSIPGWASALLTTLFVVSNVATSLVVTDLGQVLHLIGGTAACFMIFCLPGLLLMNAAIIKHTASCMSLSQMDEEVASTRGGADDEAETPRSVPLLHKKAGIRDAGFIFVGRKSWWAGLVLVLVSGVVLGITVLTAIFD